MKRVRLLLLGLAIMVGAFLFDALTRSEELPNDANIGAGLLFMIGFFVLVAGVVQAVTYKDE